MLRLTADGRSDTEIAAELGIAVETVRTYRRLLRRKLNARNMAHVVATAFRRGLVD